jgi:hypothetical protein
MDDITLLLAAWGAFLSTYLAIREVRKDKRQLKIILEYVEFFHKYRLVITNTGHRPITIEQIGLALRSRDGMFDPVPSGSEWANKEEVKLPLTLEDGKAAIFFLSDVLVGELFEPKHYLDIQIFDTEGTIHSKYTEGVYNPKYNYRMGKIKPPSFLRRTIDNIRFSLSERILRKKYKDRG